MAPEFSSGAVLVPDGTGEKLKESCIRRRRLVI